MEKMLVLIPQSSDFTDSANETIECLTQTACKNGHCGRSVSDCLTHAYLGSTRSVRTTSLLPKPGSRVPLPNHNTPPNLQFRSTRLHRSTRVSDTGSAPRIVRKYDRRSPKHARIGKLLVQYSFVRNPGSRKRRSEASSAA